MATMQPGVRELGATALTCSCWGGKAQATFPSFLRLPPPAASLSLFRNKGYLITCFCFDYTPGIDKTTWTVYNTFSSSASLKISYHKAVLYVTLWRNLNSRRAFGGPTYMGYKPSRTERLTKCFKSPDARIHLHKTRHSLERL